MRFTYIINNQKHLIDWCKIPSERFNILKDITFFDVKDGLYPIEFNISKVEDLIDLLLIERHSKPLDIPDYEGRFSENEIFEMKNFKGIELKLCNTGFDNKIIFLINIYNSILKNEKPYYLLFTKNHREFSEWQKNNG